MRESLLSSLYCGFGATRAGNPRSIAVAQAGMLRHSPTGKSPAFCTDFGGRAYISTLTTAVLRVRAGFECSDFVFDRVHWRRRESVWLSLKIAIELSRYSVPPLASEYNPPCRVAVQTVNPGFPSSVAPAVSNCSTSITPALAASASFEMA